LQHWLKDNHFAGVGGAEALARLPEAERLAWRQLWADVADTVDRAPAWIRARQGAAGKMAAPER
jgi:hypothetical protein